VAYAVIFSPAAERAVRKLDAGTRDRVLRGIDGLRSNPRPTQARTLAGSPKLWRLRIGDWRAVYEIDDKRIVVLVLKVAHRREVYR
jgi:mRNA interferase RelE/StbE